jgi:hypothetical protein
MEDRIGEQMCAGGRKGIEGITQVLQNKAFGLATL